MSDIQREAAVVTPPVSGFGLCGKIALAGVLALVAIFALVGLGGGADFHGQNYQLYTALKAHGSTMSNDEADALVNKIAEAEKLSHAEALKAAITMAGGGR